MRNIDIEKISGGGATLSKSLQELCPDNYSDIRLKNKSLPESGEIGLFNCKRKVGFTLAEVLITLGIIGIVAALLLPAVIENYEKQEALSRLKKSYTTIANALQKAAVENGDLDTWDWSNNEKIVKEYLMPNFSSVKMYGTNCRYGGCFCLAVPGGRTIDNPEIPYRWPGGQGITSPMHNALASIQFLDGSCVNFSNVNAMEVWIDINGPYKKPNKIAKDVFVFYLGNNGQLLPYTYLGCNDDLDYRAAATGTGCGARIIEDGWNIKYDWHF